MKSTPLTVVPVLALLVGCGGAVAPAAAPTDSTTTTAASAPAAESKKPSAEPTAEPAAAEPATLAPGSPAAPVPAAPAAEEAAEKCDAPWVCVKITFATRKVEKRDTKLTTEQYTWSKQSDGRTATFDQFSQGPVDLTLRRNPGNKNEVVVKTKSGGELVIDRKDGTPDDFTHIGAIAHEKDGALLIDMRYMR